MEKVGGNDNSRQETNYIICNTAAADYQATIGTLRHGEVRWPGFKEKSLSVESRWTLM